MYMVVASVITNITSAYYIIYTSVLLALIGTQTKINFTITRGPREVYFVQQK